MNKQTDIKIVPKLRFPEFKDDGEWTKTTLEKIAKFSKGKGISKSDITSNGRVPCIRYGELYTVYNETINSVISHTDLKQENLVLSCANDVIIPASGETQIDIATASCVLKDGIALGGDLNIIRTKVNGVFLSYYLNNAKKKEIAQLAQGISVVHLYANQLKKLILEIPCLSEQQKIADCLTSVDELIVAQSQKLDALKGQKKSLLQQLFPTNGEKFPKLRFKEFESDGEWKEKKLGDITLKISNKNKEGKDYPVYSINNKEGFLPQSEQFEGVSSSKRGYDTKLYKVIKRNTFAYNPARINVGSIGYSGELNNIIISSLYVCFETTDIINDKFLLTYFETYCFKQGVNDSVEGGIRNYLFYENFSKIKIRLPQMEEQQKIAKCLSSIDKLISTQTEKIDELKAHKKALMQRLFSAI